MKPEELVIGKLYWIPGQGPMRNLGPWGGSTIPDACCAFRRPSSHTTGVPVGYSASPDYVLRPVTLADVEALERMRDDARARNLPRFVREIEWVLRELRGEPQPYEPCAFGADHEPKPCSDPQCPLNPTETKAP